MICILRLINCNQRQRYEELKSHVNYAFYDRHTWAKNTWDRHPIKEHLFRNTWDALFCSTQNIIILIIIKKNDMFEKSYLWVVAFLGVYSCHRFEPGAAKFGRAGVGLCQRILKVNQHLRVTLVLLHLSRCHENGADALGQVLDLHWKHCSLKHRNSNTCLVSDWHFWETDRQTQTGRDNGDN